MFSGIIKEFPKVTQYPFGKGQTVNEETFCSKSFWVILGTQIVLWIICIF